MKRLLFFYAATLGGIIGASYFAYENYLFNELFESDKSYLSGFILLIGALSFLYYGKELVKAVTMNKLVCEIATDTMNAVSKWAMGLGFLGTMIGFTYMLTGFRGVDFQNLENVKQLFSIATTGMSTALYTSIVGIGVGIILQVFHFFTLTTIKGYLNESR